MRLLIRSEEHTSELQSHSHLVCRLLLEKKKKSTHYTSDKVNEQIFIKEIDTPQPCHQRARAHTLCPTIMSQFFLLCIFFFFFFNDTATPEIYPLSLHDSSD